MKKNFIIKMLDGGIRDISTDTWCEYRDCSTCGYGGCDSRCMGGWIFDYRDKYKEEDNE